MCNHPEISADPASVWGLITNYGEMGATKREGGGGAIEVLPLGKGGGAEEVLAMLKGGGGHKKVLGSFYAVA